MVKISFFSLPQGVFTQISPRLFRHWSELGGLGLKVPLNTTQNILREFKNKKISKMDMFKDCIAKFEKLLKEAKPVSVLAGTSAVLEKLWS